MPNNTHLDKKKSFSRKESDRSDEKSLKPLNNIVIGNIVLSDENNSVMEEIISDRNAFETQEENCDDCEITHFSIENRDSMDDSSNYSPDVSPKLLKKHSFNVYD